MKTLLCLLWAFPLTTVQAAEGEWDASSNSTQTQRATDKDEISTTDRRPSLLISNRLPVPFDSGDGSSDQQLPLSSFFTQLGNNFAQNPEVANATLGSALTIQESIIKTGRAVEILLRGMGELVKQNQELRDGMLELHEKVDLLSGQLASLTQPPSSTHDDPSSLHPFLQDST